MFFHSFGIKVKENYSWKMNATLLIHSPFHSFMLFAAPSLPPAAATVVVAEAETEATTHDEN